MQCRAPASGQTLLSHTTPHLAPCDLFLQRASVSGAGLSFGEEQLALLEGTPAHAACLSAIRVSS